jgi:4-diphosphocytidyl-2-C-methyl-D-erythritol kinase
MKNDSLVVPAPAKINLSLAVTDKRADGFHGLATVFQSISLFDRVEVKLTNQGIACWCGNLAAKEIWLIKLPKLFQQLYANGETRSTAGVEIIIDKKIPWQAGLGGGSSDAAAVLRP